MRRPVYLRAALPSGAFASVRVELVLRSRTDNTQEQLTQRAIVQAIGGRKLQHRNFNNEERTMSGLKAPTIIAGLLIAGVSFAQGAPTFESLDKNSDGQISIQEATANDDLFVAFKKLDTNQDGHLTKAEFGQYKK
jgi:EF hand